MLWLALAYADPDLAAELQRRVDLDQAARNGQADAAAVDADNRAWLTALLDERGWPVHGPFDSQNAWILCQHADVDLVRRCARLTEPLVGVGVDAKHHALLVDTAAALAGEPQTYGSRVRPDALRGAIRPCPIRDEDTVDERRADVGWEPLAAYVQAFDGHDGLPASPEPWAWCPVPGSTVVGKGFVASGGLYDVDLPIDADPLPPDRTEATYDDDGRVVLFRRYEGGHLVQEQTW